MPRVAGPVVTLTIALALWAPHAGAQAVSSSSPVPTIPASATVTVSGVFDFVPAEPVLMQTAQQGALCNPGACYSGTITVRANQRWQAQVRLRPSAPASFVAVWITAAPAQAVPLSTSFLTIATGSGASPSAPVALQFGARKASGRGGHVPTGAQLSSALEFRVVALP